MSVVDTSQPDALFGVNAGDVATQDANGNPVTFQGDDENGYEVFTGFGSAGEAVTLGIDPSNGTIQYQMDVNGNPVTDACPGVFQYDTSNQSTAMVNDGLTSYQDASGGQGGAAQPYITTNLPSTAGRVVNMGNLSGTSTGTMLGMSTTTWLIVGAGVLGIFVLTRKKSRR